MRAFQRNKINPEMGKEVNINNKVGKIISVTPGRVLIDYNHELAGKDLYYKYEIKKVINDVDGRVKAIIDMDYSDSDNFEVTIDNNTINIQISEEAKFDVNWVDSKYKIVNDIRKYLPDNDVIVKELYRKEETQEEPKEENEEEPKEENEESKEDNSDTKETEQ